MAEIVDPTHLRYVYLKDIFNDNFYAKTGPWSTEPDLIIFSYKVYPVIIRRTEFSGTFNAYVGYDNQFYLTKDGLDAHGGITYCGDYINKGDIEKYLAPDFKGDKFNWFGFDCCHGNDYRPGGLLAGVNFGGPTYKNLSYVFDNCIELADQIHNEMILKYPLWVGV